MGDQGRPRDDEIEPTSLSASVENLLEEARILLPGTQTLFGFQLIVAFNQRFDRLSSLEQWLHLAATVLTVVAIALFMAPAVYHRQVEPESVSRRFLRLATAQLALGTIPFALAVCVEVYLMTQLVIGNQVTSIVLALALLGMICVVWYVVPRWSSPEAARTGGS